MTEQDHGDSSHSERLSIYVPRGFMALKSCVLELAASLHPDLPIEDYLRGFNTPFEIGFDPYRTQPVYDPYCDRPDDPSAPCYDREILASRAFCFSALVEARDDLRQALAESDLCARSLEKSGHVPLVPSRYWRTDAGFLRLIYVDRVDEFIHVFLPAADFSRWLKSQTADEPELSDTATTPDDLTKARSLLLKSTEQPDARSISKPEHRSRVQASVAISNSSFNSIWLDLAKAPGKEWMSLRGRKLRKKIE